MGLTNDTRRRPWLTRLLTKLVAQSQPGFSFLSVNLSVNTIFKPHKDHNTSERDSVLLGLSKFDGGQLWLEHEAGNQDSEDDEGKPSAVDEDESGPEEADGDQSVTSDEAANEGNLPAEVYAQEYKAKRKVNEIKQMRQFFRKGGSDKAKAWIKEQQKKEPCFLCNKLGHWSQECPMRKKNAPRPSHQVHVTLGQPNGGDADWSGFLPGLIRTVWNVHV